MKSILAGLVAMTLIAAALPTSDPYAVSSDCARHVPDEACSIGPDIGRWLPGVFDRWLTQSPSDATRTSIHDYFVYDIQRTRRTWLAPSGPVDGTYFAYGVPGQRGRVVYDRRRSVAFFEQGCAAWLSTPAAKGARVADWWHTFTFSQEGCLAWFSTVAAIGVVPPPRVVAYRDLSTLRTRTGARLGDSPADIEKIFGARKLYSLYKHVGPTYLMYRAELPQPRPPAYADCAVVYLFIFNERRLTLIQMSGGC
ncbi:MAG: hypothetical protein JOZ24_04550 [Candidatus Eremiobacteraeota bacterium]|nr:hypothetical protein [Candidatus Eremiobacteraeota bacterium]